MTHRLAAQTLLFLPDANERDNACHIKTLTGQRLHIDAETTQVTNKLEAGVVSLFKINDRVDNELVSIPTGTTNRFEFNSGATVDFNGCTVEGFAGGGVGQLEASQINSSNTGYTTVDNELDDLQVRCTANTNRTTGLTANRMLESSGAGIIRASGIISSNVANKGSSTTQTFISTVASDTSLFAGTASPASGDGTYKNVNIDGTISAIELTNYVKSSGVDTPTSCVIKFNDDIHGLRIQDNSDGDLEILASSTKGSLNLAAGDAMYKINGAQISTSDLSDGTNIVIDDFTGVQTLDCSVLQLNGAQGLRFGSLSQYFIKSDYTNNRLLYSSNFDHVFQAGTNGATTACQIADDGVNIIDLSDASIGYTAPAGISRVATRAYVGALLQSSTTQTAIINTVEYTNTVFREYDATPTALTLTINRPTTITKNVNMTSGDMTISNALSCNDLTVVNNVLDDLTFATDKTIDFSNTASFTAGHVLALDTNKKLTARAISGADDNVCMLSGAQTLTNLKTFTDGLRSNDDVYIEGTKNLKHVTETNVGGIITVTETEYVASKLGQFAVNSLTNMTAAAPANTQKTIAYLENTGQTIFESSVGTNNSADTSRYAILHQDGYLTMQNEGQSKIELDIGGEGLTMQNSGGTLNVDTHINISEFSVYKINGSQIGTGDLADGANVAFTNTAQTFTAAQTFNDLNVSTGNDITRNSITDYLDRIDRLYTDYRRNIVSTELFGADWITPTLYKEYQSNGTEYTGTGSAPTYAEITVLKWARSIASSDPSDSSKYTQFTHNVNQNTAWDLDYSTVAEGLLKSGVFTCQLTMNGNNRGASTNRFSDYAFIGNTWVSNASCRVDIHNNIHGVNDSTPDYTPLSTSCTFHANASTSTDEFSTSDQPVFLLKNVASSPFELVFRFPITGYTPSYGYFTSASDAGAFLQKKNVNVQVKFKQVDDWNHFPVDFTAYDYTS